MARWVVAISCYKDKNRKEHLLEPGGGEGNGEHNTTTGFWRGGTG